MGLFDSDSDVSPELTVIDEPTRQAMERMTKEATGTSAQDYAKKSMEGIAPKDYSAQIAQEDKQMGGYEPGISGAIQGRYKGLVAEKLQALKNKAELQGYETQHARLQKAQMFQTAKMNIDAENKKRVYEAELANSSARNAAIASVFGIGAMIVGGIVGGPAGAVVGQQVGSSAGQAVASGRK